MNVSLFLINCSVVLLQLLSPSAFAARRFFFVGETNFGMFLFPIIGFVASQDSLTYRY